MGCGGLMVVDLVWGVGGKVEKGEEDGERSIKRWRREGLFFFFGLFVFCTREAGKLGGRSVRRLRAMGIIGSMEWIIVVDRCRFRKLGDGRCGNGNNDSSSLLYLSLGAS